METITGGRRRRRRPIHAWRWDRIIVSAFAAIAVVLATALGLVTLYMIVTG